MTNILTTAGDKKSEHKVRKYYVHDTGGKSLNSFKFLLCETTQLPYCAKNMNPPWNVKTFTTSGCRRPFDKNGGPGFCNAKTQGSCRRSDKCMCGAGQAVVADEAGGEGEVHWKTRKSIDEYLETLQKRNPQLQTVIPPNDWVLSQWWGRATYVHVPS